MPNLRVVDGLLGLDGLLGFGGWLGVDGFRHLPQVSIQFLYVLLLRHLLLAALHFEVDHLFLHAVE